MGFPRSLGQIYAALYFSPAPLGHEELKSQLGLSKAAVSTSLRQLEQLGLVRQVWQQGSRRDYYEANDDFPSILRRYLNHIIKPRLDFAATLLNSIEKHLLNESPKTQTTFRRERIRRLKNLRKKIASLLPLAEGLLK